MTARFASNLIVLVAGCFLAAATFAFAVSVIGWVGLAVGCVLGLTVLMGFATSGRGIVQRALDCVIVLLAAWTIVASQSFAGDALKWLMFASGALAALIAVEALVAHEVVMEVSLRRAAERERELAAATPSSLPGDQPSAIRVAG